MGPAKVEGFAMSVNGGQQRGKRKEHEVHQACRKYVQSGLFLGVLSVLAFPFVSSLSAADPRAAVIVVIGAEGTKEYGEQFRQWALRWEAAAKQASADFVAIGLDDAGGKTDREL